jgi:uncharacterized integral membrane protein
MRDLGLSCGIRDCLLETFACCVVSAFSLLLSLFLFLVLTLLIVLHGVHLVAFACLFGYSRIPIRCEAADVHAVLVCLGSACVSGVLHARVLGASRISVDL